jgi:hypothetical protein
MDQRAIEVPRIWVSPPLAGHDKETSLPVYFAREIKTAGTKIPSDASDKTTQDRGQKSAR